MQFIENYVIVMISVNYMLYRVLYVCNSLIVGAFFSIILIFLLIRAWVQKRKAKISTGDVVSVGIFHPFCHAGGGGERVLWCAVRALQAKYDNIQIVIYAGNHNIPSATILKKVKDVFNITIDSDTIQFVQLHHWHLLESSVYPYFTLLGQSLGSIIVGIEALTKFPPKIYLDTTGFAFTLPIFRFLGCCKIGCYVHYPTISSDMLRRVQQRDHSPTNGIYVARNPFLTWIKLAYYKLFAKAYSWVGRSSDTIMVNSTWTENHILDLWKVPFKTHRVYPPCDTNSLNNLTDTKKTDQLVILSIGQFRPEKDHPLQLQALYELRTLLVNNEELWNKIRLVIIGSCRNKDDYTLLNNIKDLAKHLSLEESVDFVVNASHEDLINYYKKANIGIHTMWNEHFGIGIVDCMAAGIIMVAHKSGGPLLDIIETSEGSQTGYLASDAIEYANCILNIILNTKETNADIRRAAVASVDRFSEKEFEINFMRAMIPLLSGE